MPMSSEPSGAGYICACLHMKPAVSKRTTFLSLHDGERNHNTHMQPGCTLEGSKLRTAMRSSMPSPAACTAAAAATQEAPPAGRPPRLGEPHCDDATSDDEAKMLRRWRMWAPTAS